MTLNITMTNKLKYGKMDENIEKSNRELEFIKKNQIHSVEMKNILSEVFNILDEFGSTWQRQSEWTWGWVNRNYPDWNT